MTWIKKYFYLFPVLLYLPALGNFFSADDWFHLHLTQISTLPEFFNFFSFSQNSQTASFYRPIPTQVFFFFFQKIFGLNAWAYYLFGLTLFAYILYLIKKFSETYLPLDISYLPSLIYGLSVSNFTRVYFLSAYQELFLVTFSLLSLINYKKKPILSLVFFVLALMSKETAIVIPVLILLLNVNGKKAPLSTIYNLRFSILASLLYLYFRLFHFGLAEGVSYVWDFSPTKAINTTMWYILWAIGAPELLIDYIGSGLRPVPRFFADYSSWWPVITFPLLVIVGLLNFTLFKNFKKISLTFWIFSVFFFFSLLPFLFLPSHKFALELGLALVGFSLAISLLLQKTSRVFYFAFLGVFLFYNLSMNYLTLTRHYSVSRGQISKKIHQFFSQNYSTPPVSRYFEFINDATDYGEIWGQSKQISQSLSSSDFFKVFYKNPDYKVYYQDIKEERPPQSASSAINISTKQFLNQ